MEVEALENGKTVAKPLNRLIEEHFNLSDTASWYICSLGEKLQQLQAENEQQADFMALSKKEMDAFQTENERLKEALEEASRDFYYIHCHSEDAHTDSYTFMGKVDEALKGKDD